MQEDTNLESVFKYNQRILMECIRATSERLVNTTEMLYDPYHYTDAVYKTFRLGKFKDTGFIERMSADVHGDRSLRDYLYELTDILSIRKSIDNGRPHQLSVVIGSHSISNIPPDDEISLIPVQHRTKYYLSEESNKGFSDFLKSNPWYVTMIMIAIYYDYEESKIEKAKRESEITPNRSK